MPQLTSTLIPFILLLSQLYPLEYKCLILCFFQAILNHAEKVMIGTFLFLFFIFYGSVENDFCGTFLAEQHCFHPQKELAARIVKQLEKHHREAFGVLLIQMIISFPLVLSDYQLNVWCGDVECQLHIITFILPLLPSVSENVVVLLGLF